MRLDSTPAVPPPLPEVSELLAGVAQVDLTPPPGLPKAGYSQNAHTGTGFRTRLRATVLHLRRGRTSLAIIASDLLGGSALVQQLVAAHVASLTDVPLSGAVPERDTHARCAGPVSWDRLLQPILVQQAGRGPGLDGVRRRTDQLRSRLGVRHQATGGAGVGRRTAPLAALALFSVHGTAVPMSSRTHNADLWGYLCAELGQRVAQTHGPIVAAALQGTHGDVGPAFEAPAGHREAARIGRGIAAAAGALYSQPDGARRW